MARNRRTVKQAMKYWRVGWHPQIVIRARTARAAVRKWMRGSMRTNYAIRSYELDNPGGSGDMPHEVRKHPGRNHCIKRHCAEIAVSDVPVERA